MLFTLNHNYWPLNWNPMRLVFFHFCNLLPAHIYLCPFLYLNMLSLNLTFGFPLPLDPQSCQCPLTISVCVPLYPAWKPLVAGKIKMSSCKLAKVAYNKMSECSYSCASEFLSWKADKVHFTRALVNAYNFSF